MQRANSCTEAAAIRRSVFARESCSYCVEIGLRLSWSDTWLQPGDQIQEMRTGIVFLQQIPRERGRDPRFGISVREMKSGGHDAHDDDRAAVELNRLVDDRRISAETSLP